MSSSPVRRPLVGLAAAVLGTAVLVAAAPQPGAVPPPVTAPSQSGATPASLGMSLSADAAGPPALRGRPDPGSLIRDAGALSPDALGDILRAHVARTAGVGRDPLLHAGSGAEEETALEEATAESAEEPTWVEALPGGDLDGDGLEDVLTVEHSAGTRTVVARRGLDGTELWRRDEGAVADAYAFAGPDLTGDGAEDLILWSLHWHEDEGSYGCSNGTDGSECVDERSGRFTWTIGAVDGADGASLWQRSTDGAFEGRFVTREESDPIEGDRVVLERDYESTGDWLFPVVSADHDGDGRPDLLLDRIDAVDYDLYIEHHDMGPEAPVAGHAAVADRSDVSLAIDSAVEAVAGADGAMIAEFAAEGEPAEPWALPLGGDATGDDLEDVAVLWFRYDTGSSECARDGVLGLETPVTCTSTQTSEHGSQVELRDAGDLAPVWERELDGGYALPSGADSTGDGIPDLLSVRFGMEGDTVGVLSGADGADVWQQTIDGWASVLPMDDLDGDGTADVLIPILRFDFDTGEDRLLLRRAEGPSGATIVETEHQLGGGDGDGSSSVFVQVGAIPDTTGNGIGDVLADIFVAEESGGEWTETRSLTIEDGGDGAVLWSTEDTERWPWDVVDLDGDGAADVLLLGFDDHDAQLEAVDVAAGGSSLWILDGLHLYFLPWVIEDVDGDGGADLLQPALADGSDPMAGVEVRRGADLDLLWFAGG